MKKGGAHLEKYLLCINMTSARVWSLEATQQSMAGELATVPPPSKYKKPSPSEDSYSCQGPTAPSTNRRRHGKDIVLRAGGGRWLASGCVQLYASHHKDSQGASQNASSQVPLSDSEWVGALESVFFKLPR